MEKVEAKTREVQEPLYMEEREKEAWQQGFLVSGVPFPEIGKNRTGLMDFDV